MDARIDPARLLGLEEGDAHVIRNAGGPPTDDAVRSLAISQRALATEEVVVIQHTPLRHAGLLGRGLSRRARAGDGSAARLGG
jgi:hypothetical protein